VIIKDNIDVAGECTRAGSAVLDTEPLARSDAPAVARLRAAGAVLVGRTNMVEFAYGAHGVNERFGTPTNPTSPDEPLLPGGSCSGAAVSVAAGMATIALGTDTAGSCRIPAALYGVVGFKPRRGLIPADGLVPLAQSLDVVGVIAGSVDCCARIFTALVPAAVGLKQNEPSRPRVGVLRTTTELDPPVAEAFEQACAALCDAGLRCVRLSSPSSITLAR
jgi:aspartyl-tRNA(Asn)/glutamyl-tRNA(Gln) amidotransferase subunit A